MPTHTTMKRLQYVRPISRLEPARLVTPATSLTNLPRGEYQHVCIFFVENAPMRHVATLMSESALQLLSAAHSQPWDSARKVLAAPNAISLSALTTPTLEYATIRNAVFRMSIGLARSVRMPCFPTCKATQSRPRI